MTTRLEHTIDIEKPLSEVYARARDVERYPEFLPGYLESRIVDRQDGRVLLERKALMRGTVRAWKSWVRFETDRKIHFEHAAGPLKGMHVYWQFSAPAASRTRLAIIHELTLRKPPLVGWYLEKWFYAPRVSEMADRIVVAFKKACEQSGEG